MKHLILIVLALTSFKSFGSGELTLHFYPSYDGINWRSPRALLRSVMRNYAAQDSHSIGHVDVELRCNGTSTFVGASSADDEVPAQMIIQKGYGYGILFVDMKGKLLTQKDILKELGTYQNKGNISFVRFLVSDTNCQRMSDYLSEYRRLGYGKHYGLPNRPRYREGAGCSAFGASFLEVAGIMSPIFEQAWKRTAYVSENFIGGPLTGKWISTNEILFAEKFNRWTEPNVKSWKVTFWDPERMYEWAVAAHHGRRETPAWKSWPANIENAKGIIFDTTDVATPKEPFFLTP